MCESIIHNCTKLQAAIIYTTRIYGAYFISHDQAFNNKPIRVVMYFVYNCLGVCRLNTTPCNGWQILH